MEHEIKTIISDIKHKTSHTIEFVSSNHVEDALSAHGIRIRRIFAPILRRIYRTQSEYRLVIEKRDRLPKNRNGYIFVVNHRQSDDIVLGVNVIGENGYIVFGNKELAFETTNGFGLWAYGMILLNRGNKNNRNSTYEKMKYVLEHGGNVIIYPEGYWNLDDDGQADARHGADRHNSANWLIQDFNIGVFRLAQETGAKLVPIVLHYDEFKRKMCYARRGKPFGVEKKDNIFDAKDKLLEIMWTMYFELMERYSTYQRTELEDYEGNLQEQWLKLKEKLIADCEIASIDYHLDLKDEKRIGKAKVQRPVTTYAEAFAFRKYLKPKYENAFLFRE